MLFTIGKKHTEEQQLKGCQKRDEKICNETYKTWAPYMKAVCLRYVADAELAEDIMQDAFIKIFSSLDKLEWKGEGSFKAWMVRIMVNSSIDFLKKEKRLVTVSIDYSDEISADEDDQDDEPSLFGMVKQQGLGKDELMAMLESLPESNRLVFNLYAIEQLKHKEIAEVLGIAEEASRARLKRARIQLKEKLAIRCHYIQKAVLV
jgi:RNA polymerase sigma-70 factor, ECF subfamily